LVPLDFAGTTDTAIAQGNTTVYLLISLALGSAAFLWRRQQAAAGWR